MSADSTFFSIPHLFKVYLEPWNSNQPLPNTDEIKNLQSTGLRLVNETKELENTCLFKLRQIEIDAKPIVDYLKLQSQKIDLVLQFMLEQEMHHGDLYSGVKFGGGGFSIKSATAFAERAHFKATLFIKDELICVLCIAEVNKCKKGEVDPYYSVNFNFKVIQTNDIEQLVQASLRVQQKQLHNHKKSV